MKLSLTAFIGVPQRLINLLKQSINETEVMSGDNTKQLNRLVTHVNIEIKHLLTSELLEYMSLTKKGPAKSKPVTWNWNFAHTWHSGSAGVSDDRNAFPWTFLYFTQNGLPTFDYPIL